MWFPFVGFNRAPTQYMSSSAERYTGKCKEAGQEEAYQTRVGMNDVNCWLHSVVLYHLRVTLPCPHSRRQVPTKRYCTGPIL